MARKRSKQSQLKKKQPAKSRLFHPVQKKPRVKHIYLPLTFSRRLDFAFRRFKTSKKSRSKKQRQLVLPTPLIPFKELAISQSRRKKPVRAKAKKAPVTWRRWQVAIPALIIIIGLAGTAYFAINLLSPDKLEPVATNKIPTPAIVSPITPPPPQSLPRSEPTRLVIPRLGIETSFISVGRQADGTMEVPKRYDIVGWYKHAPTPGELGPAIVVGHVDRPKGTAIFWRLREMLPGDTFEVDRADGKTVKFKVDEVKQFPQDNFPTTEVYGNIDHAGIRLITCGGVFNRQTQQYSHNTVVYGTLVI